MDDAGGLRCRIALVNRPGSHFLDAGREVGLQTEEVVTGANHAIEPRFVHAHVFQEHGFVFIIKFGDFSFGLGADSYHGGVFAGGQVFDGVKQRIVFKAVFGDVGNVHDGFEREQEEGTDDREFFLGELGCASGLSFVEEGQNLLEDLHELQSFLVTALTSLFAPTVERLFNGGKVGKS